MIGTEENLVVDLDTETWDFELFLYCKDSSILFGQKISLLLKDKLVRGICVNVVQLEQS